VSRPFPSWNRSTLTDIYHGTEYGNGRAGSVGGCFPVLEARPCADGDGTTMRAAQLWHLRGPLKQLSSPAAARGEPAQCVTAIPPVPLIQVAAATRVLGPGGEVASAEGRTPVELKPFKLLADGSVEVNMTLEMRAGEVYTMVTAVVTTNDLARSNGSTEEDVISAAEQMLGRVTTRTGVAALRQQHIQWWTRFWNASSVELGAERRTLEGFWYGMQYMAGSMNRAGKQAAGLWGPWIQSDDMNWNGGAASVASFLAAVFTEIYLCNVCSCQEILRRNGRG
jgi:hypothetical protein